MKKTLLLLLLLCSSMAIYAKKFNVRDFGAAGDGRNIDSPAINEAIQKASEAGGGTVVIPEGTYLSYSIRLKSNVELHLEEGATILSAVPTAAYGYDVPEPAVNTVYQGFGHNHVHNSLIYGVGLENITISGKGLIDGSMLDSWTEGLPYHGNKGIGLRDCRNVVFKDITVFRAGHFALHLTAVDNLLIEGVTVDSDRDGIDIICCKGVVVRNCRVNSPQDDSIVLKSPYTMGCFRDVENVLIEDCAISGYKCGTLLDGTKQRFTTRQDAFRSGGRIKLGTESSGGYKNIRVKDCTLDYCGGIMLQSMDGGIMEDVIIDGVTIRDGLSSPIFVRLGARMRSPEGTPVGKIRNVHLRNIKAFNAESWNASIISGVPGHCVEDMSFSNIEIHYQGGFTAEDGKLTPPEFEKDYPEPWMFGTSPAKGFYIRHSKDIRFDNVKFHYEKEDGRPLFVEEDTENIEYNGICCDGRPLDSFDGTISLNGRWEYGIDREYKGVTYIPNILLDPEQITEGTLWYRKEVRIPEGNWNSAVLELNGARFRPSVYVNGVKVSEAEGGMAKTVHKLGKIDAGTSIVLEVALKSLADVPLDDASYIPKVDQWRSNCSSCIWDDVNLRLFKDVRVDRVLTYSNVAEKSVGFKYRVCDGSAAEARLKIYDEDKLLWSGTGKAEEGENMVSFNYDGILSEWSPVSPDCYRLKVSLIGQDGEELSVYNQTVGIREMKIKDKHFMLNGSKILPSGGSICWHRWVRDENAREIAYDSLWMKNNVIDAIKDRGGNYLRFHLGLPPERILDMCDRYGLMVQYEWSFFHGMPASLESLVEQYGAWLDLASRHPSVMFFHPYNETSPTELERVWQALDSLCVDYPDLVLADRDVTHIHRYWWGMSENLGLYYDSYEQFAKAIIIDEFGGFYLDEEGGMGAYPMLASAEKRWMGEIDDVNLRLQHQCLATGKLGEYWRMIGAAGLGAFAITSSYEDGNHWYMGDPAKGVLKPVWDALATTWSARTAIPEIWNRNFATGSKYIMPVHLINDSVEDSDMEALVQIISVNGDIVYEKSISAMVQAGCKTVVDVTLCIPKASGSYTVVTTLLNPEQQVKVPVRSKWEIAVLDVAVPENLKGRKVYVPVGDRELVAMARNAGLELSGLDQAELILAGRDTWLNLDASRKFIDEALLRGVSVVMLDVGERYLGKQYIDNQSNLEQAIRPIQTSTVVNMTDVVAGLSLHSNILPEGEGYVHKTDAGENLWDNLTPFNTWLWNGMRGGLMVPAEGMELHGLSQEAFLNQWIARGASSEKIISGPYYAYEHCGFYDFSDSSDNEAIKKGLKDKVLFLIEDMPALDLSLDKNSPVQVTDLNAGYLDNQGGRATEFIALAVAGKDLVRTPVIQIMLGKEEGTLILSQLLTGGRLAEGFADMDEAHPAEYDPAAVQFVLNLLSQALK